MATLIYFFVNTLSVSAAIGLSSRQNILQTWYQNFFWTGPSYFVGSIVAALIAIFIQRIGALALLLAIPPLVIFYYSYRLYLSRIEETRDLFQRVIESMSEALFLLDRDGRVVRANPGAGVLFECDEAELVGRRFSELCGAGKIPVISCEVLERTPNGTLMNQDIQIRTQLEHVISISFSSGLLRDKQGKITGVLVVARDITELKQSEEALRDSEALYYSLVESLPQNIFRKDRDGRFTFGNKRFCAILEKPINEILGKTDLDFYPPELAEKYRQDDRRVIETGRIIETVEEHQPPGGEKIYVQVIKTPIYDFEENIIGTQGIFWDVTERKRAEEALGHSEKHFRSLIENASDIITLLNSDGTIRYQSPSIKRILGYQPEDLVGKTVSELVHPDDLPKVITTFHYAIQKPGVPLSIELRFRHKDSSWRILEAIGSNLLNDPAVAGVVVNCRDITDRKQVEEALCQSEEQLRQSQKMEAVGTLASGVAHDFNNLLTVIMGYSNLALNHLRDGDPLRADIGQIWKAGERAASLTRQLLAFSRKQVLQPRVLDINAVVADMDKMLRRLIGEDIDLVTVLSPAVGRVKTDPGQMEQVIMNLAVNARDAMPTGGKLTIETVNLDWEEDHAYRRVGIPSGRYVMLAVSDAGCGMDAETRSHIFEPFFTTKERGKGTGLGLSTVYGIVKQSGGYIEVDSEPGRGTTFKIYLPRFEEADASLKPGALRSQPSRGLETVLLVEDDELVRALVRQVLHMNGYIVLEASSGSEALRICEQHTGPIPLMVTDVVMPHMSGCELAQRVIPLRPEMRVLYMSGYTGNAVAQHGVLDPGIAFLQKPIASDDLVHKVRELLDAPRSTCPNGSATKTHW
jgi:PAS domain S-box-containing protein